MYYYITETKKYGNSLSFLLTTNTTKYDMGRNKVECDREMIKSLDQIPYGEMPKWGSTARFLINTKQKLGLGVNSKNEKRR